MIHRILVLMWKEFIELRRDPRLFGLVIVAPVMQLAVPGYARTTERKRGAAWLSRTTASPAGSETRASRREASTLVASRCD